MADKMEESYTALISQKMSEASTLSQASSDDGSPKVSFDLQASLFREPWNESQDCLDQMTMEALNTKASCFLMKKFPDAAVSYPTLGQRLLLYRHDPQDTNILQLLRSPRDICNGDVIEIVLSVEAAKDKVNISKHNLVVHSYKGPTFCDYCDEFLWGLVKQGLKCTACGKNYHKRCVYHIPNDCEGYRSKKPSKRPNPNDLKPPVMPHQSGMSGLSISTGEPVEKRPTSSNLAIGGRPIELEWKLHNKPMVPHTFVIHSYPVIRPTQCKKCTKLLSGVMRQGLQCRDCKYNACTSCVNAGHIPNDCPGEADDDSLPEKSSINSGSVSEADQMDTSDMGDTADEDQVNDINLGRMSMHARPNQGDMIPVIRIAQSMRNSKHKKEVKIQGYLIHTTNNDDMRRRHYWRLDGKSLQLFMSEEEQRISKEIPLASVLDCRLAEIIGVNHLELQLSGEIVYYIADDTSVKQTVSLRLWYDHIKKALRPMDPHPNIPQQNPAITKKQLSNIMSLDPDERSATDVEQIYQIFHDEILGSGQFGVVYAAKHRRKPLQVAIKQVDKKRFQNKDNRLIHEVQILAGLHHPGIVNLFNMFENQNQIFVVMEKLQGDMLDMIMSSEHGKLDERITKFLITQILDALRYLHDKNIVHCDLKPENVLTANSDSSLPQVKLCDFGFARIIGEKSFRRSVVGTPAYLAPEVLNNTGYNRTLDMWSVGVIIYVSLSGTFPFNDEEDIVDQIQNADFMFPDNPWKEISNSAIDLIKHLLQVQRRRRLTVDRAMLHDYFKDYQTFLDLRKLEERINTQQWTSSDHWAEVAARYGPHGTHL